VPVHVEEMVSEVTVADGGLPLTPAQIEQLVALVLRRLAEKQRAAASTREARQMHPSAAPDKRRE
jgi:hypothetical protein